jgi:DNA primase
LLLPDGEDPDSYSRKTSLSEFQRFIQENEQDFIHFKTHLLLKDAQRDPVKRANLIRDIVQTIAVIPDSITRSEYIKECSNWLQVEEGMLYMEINKARRKIAEQNYMRLRRIENQITKTIPVNQQASFIDDTEAQEKEIIRLLLNYGDREFRIPSSEHPKKESQTTVAQFIVNEIANDELEMSHPVFKQIFEEYQHHLIERKPIGQKYFIHHQDKSIRDTSADLLSISYDLSKIWRKHENYIESEEMKLREILPETLTAFKNKRIIMAIKEVQNRIKTAQETDHPEEIEGLQEQFMILSNLKKKLSRDLGDRTIL